MKKKKNTVQEFIDILNQMKLIGIDVSKIRHRDTIETLAKKSGINRKELEEIGLDPTQRIGVKKIEIARAYRGQGTLKPPTNEQVEELEKLGISLEEKDSVQEFIDTLNQMKSIGVDVSNVKQRDTIETLAKKSDISKEKIEEIGLDPTQKIGAKKISISRAYRGKGGFKTPTNEQVEELKKLGISLEEKEYCTGIYRYIKPNEINRNRCFKDKT